MREDWEELDDEYEGGTERIRRAPREEEPRPKKGPKKGPKREREQQRTFKKRNTEQRETP